MKWSLRIGSVRGTHLYVHWTFLLLLAWVFLSGLRSGGGVEPALGGVLFITTIFACVLLHELGHATAARAYGIPTTDITLLPIGGVARLERIPEKPAQEFWVALAGPAVNVVIAGVLYLFLAATHGVRETNVALLGNGDFALRLMIVNIALVLFNLLPAFPMDGGRVLRAVLAMRLPRRKATRIAAGVGQVMAVLFGFAGLFVLHNPLLIIIAFFIFIGAESEARMVEVTTALHDLKVGDAMMTRFRTLSGDDTLARAVDELLAGSQQDFPVISDGAMVGVLRRKDLVRALSESGPAGRVSDAMTTGCPVARLDDPLEQAFTSLREGQCAAVPVFREQTMVGLLTLENISERMMVNSALEQKPTGAS